MTAQKKEERLQDVPVPVTVIDSTTLATNNKPRLEDFFDTVPGLTLSSAMFGWHTLSIRGIAPSTGANTVAVLMDDVPFNAVNGLITQSFIPEIDPSELAHVEVLRGPQGTLYGASSMGGLIKYVTEQPSTEKFSGHLQADLSGIHDGDGAGYALRGAVNVPIADTLALRASAFTRHEPGWIDNPVLGIKGINDSRVSGGRLSALWRPSDALSLRVSALYQDTRAGSSNDEMVPTAGLPQTAGLGANEQNYLIGCCKLDGKLQAYSAELTAKAGIVDLTSVSGYSQLNLHPSQDYSRALGAAAERDFGVSGVLEASKGTAKVFTQEVRASMPLSAVLDLLVGGFFTSSDTSGSTDLIAVDPATGAQVGLEAFYNKPVKYSEYAGFTTLNVHVSDRFNVQVGARESRARPVAKDGEFSGPLVGGTVPLPGSRGAKNAFTYLLTPQFKVSPDLMVYARFASGFRPGLPNGDPNPAVPVVYKPDRTETYEVGVKGRTPNNLLSFDASLYHIKWKSMQISVLDTLTGVAYGDNGGSANSDGIELSTELRPLTGLTVSSWIAYNNAKLTEDFPPLPVNGICLAPDGVCGSTYGVEGMRLPNATRYSGNFAINQSFPLRPNVTGSAGVLLSYIGKRIGMFELSPALTRPEYPGYSKIDVHVGVDLQSLSFNLYANNITNKRGLLAGGDYDGTFLPSRFYIQPRTVGLSMIKTF